MFRGLKRRYSRFVLHPRIQTACNCTQFAKQKMFSMTLYVGGRCRSWRCCQNRLYIGLYACWISLVYFWRRMAIHPEGEQEQLQRLFGFEEEEKVWQLQTLRMRSTVPATPQFYPELKIGQGIKVLFNIKRLTTIHTNRSLCKHVQEKCQKKDPQLQF